MKKINSTTYKGIEYIRLSALPVEEAKTLKQTLNERSLIKILKGDIILDDCVLYSVYMRWYNSLNTEEAPTVTHSQEPEIREQITIA